MFKQRLWILSFLLAGITLQTTAQTFTEQGKTYPISADGNKYVVTGFTPFSQLNDEGIFANTLLWTVENVCPKLREGITEVNVPATKPTYPVPATAIFIFSSVLLLSVSFYRCIYSRLAFLRSATCLHVFLSRRLSTITPAPATA